METKKASPRMGAYLREVIAREVSATSRYYDRVIQWRPLEHDGGELLAHIDCKDKLLLPADAPLPDLSNERDRRTIVLLNGVLNHHYDIEKLLAEAKGRVSRTTRIAIIAYNPYLQFAYRAASRVGLRNGPPPSTFITRTELDNLAKLGGFEVVSIRPTGYAPLRAAGVGDVVNRVMPALPGSRSLSSSWLILLRPVMPETRKPSLSIVIPARNERGNIEPAVTRLRYMKPIDPEIVFVEGHSNDGTFDEIERVRAKYSGEFRITALRQEGKGKNDAVRLGFSKSTSELLTILDADLTMPPELLHRFYDAYCAGLGDFINGNRLTYPMEVEAMRPLNHAGNVFFAKALSSVLGAKIGDSLCGTKLVARHDYRRIVEWRNDFGDFDPFGDFELLFPAAVLGLGIIDVPIRYLARTYGETNINRVRHGLMLAKMTGIGLFNIKTGKA